MFLFFEDFQPQNVLIFYKTFFAVNYENIILSNLG